jgi:hypothetical protein
MTSRKPAKVPGVNGYKYRQQFGIIIVCESELKQTRTFNRLKRLGYKCKVVTV